MGAETPRSSSAGVWLRLAASVGLGGAFVLALGPYLDAMPDDLEVAPAALAGYVATLLPFHLLRAGRWVFLLRPVAPQGPKLPLPRITQVSLAGYMWIALLPFRLGEFARPLFVAQCTPVGVPQALGTIAIERAFDGVVVCVLFFVGMAGATATGDTAGFYIAAYVVMGGFSAALLGMLASARWPDRVASWVGASVRWASPRLADWTARTIRGVAEGFAAMPSLSALAWFAVATAGYWASNAAGMWILAHGCGLRLSLLESVVVLAVMNLALLIPGGPAQLGVFQTGVALGLHLFVPSDEVMAHGSRFAFFLYVCQLGSIAALGLVAQRNLRLDWRAVLRPRSQA